VRVTDLLTGLAASDPATLVGACPIPTSTSLSIPDTVDTGWTTSLNPAQVTVGGSSVLYGTVTITINGITFCSYPAGVPTGCTLAHLPVGTDQVKAAYSGSAVPWYAPSSATTTVRVLPVFTSMSSTSTNWAGYVDTGDTYTSVSGSWTVPTSNCGTFPFGDAGSASATWVGIDGNTTNTVEQIGTDSACIGWAGHYWAWWEMAPNGPTLIDMISHPVNSGDRMTANVTSTGTPGSYNLTITDATRGWTYTTTQSIAGAVGGSAEWITEQPSDGGFPFTNFGSVTFTQAQATGSNGISTPIWDHPNLAVNMTSGTTTKAVAFPLSNDGTQFTTTWLHG
jgi:hypothetical protein